MITCSLGARYKSYCANIGRTYVINPSKGTEKLYKLLLEMQQEAIGALRPGAPLSAAYTAALNRLKSKAPHLEKKMTKNAGFAIGIEFREATMQLNGKNEARVRPGMTFNVAVGLEDLEDKEATDKRGQTYALFLADTVCVVENGPPEIYTDKAPKAWTEVKAEPQQQTQPSCQAAKPPTLTTLPLPHPFPSPSALCTDLVLPRRRGEDLRQGRDGAPW